MNNITYLKQMLKQEAEALAKAVEINAEQIVLNSIKERLDHAWEDLRKAQA